ncbi:unnamed protein product, partial [Ceratitis capitata]
RERAKRKSHHKRSEPKSITKSPLRILWRLLMTWAWRCQNARARHVFYSPILELVITINQQRTAPAQTTTNVKNRQKGNR